MSRIGKKPVALPKGVTASIEGQTVKVKGPKGELSVKLVREVSASIDEHGITVTPDKNQERSAQMWGLSRSLVNNLVTGVTTGFTQRLEIQGVGYRAAVQGKSLTLTLGYSHLINYAVPEGVTIETPTQTEIIVKGIDRQRIGQTAAEIRSFRSPEPYKGKGVKYSDEKISLKEAKKK
jgi:large subunit ribosomal protein L6